MNPNINEKIIEKIENMKIPDNKKEFLIKALDLEYENRDLGEILKEKYMPLIDKYSGEENDN